MKNVILLILILIVSSCAKKAGMTSSKIKIVGANAFSAGGALETMANNGLILYGMSTDGKSFSKKIDNDSEELVFPNGTWNFYAVAWQYATPTVDSAFRGTARCAKQKGIALNGTDTSVNLTLNNTNCNDPEFSSSVFFNSGISTYQLPQRDFLACKDQTKATAYGDIAACSRTGIVSNRGYATYYRIYIPQYKKFGNGIEGYAPALVSKCIELDSNNATASAASIDAPNLTAMSFPDPINGLGIMLRTYYSQAACDDARGFDDIVAPMEDTPRTKKFIFSGGSQSVVRYFYQSNEDQACQPPRLNVDQNYAGGRGSQFSPFYICTREQFNKISDNYATASAQSFELLRDLDFAFTQFNPIGHPIDASNVTETTGFAGYFYGNDKRVSNFFIRNLNNLAFGKDVGFFRRVATSGGSIPRISNLTLQRAATLGTDKFNRVGLLAGSIDNSDITNIKVFGHAEGAGIVGGVVGELTNTMSATTASNIVAEVDVNGKLDTNYLLNYGVGGFAGSISASNTFAINNVAIRGTIRGGESNEKFLNVPSGLYNAVSVGVGYTFTSMSSIQDITVQEKITQGATYLLRVNLSNYSTNVQSLPLYSLNSSTSLGVITGTTKIQGTGGFAGTAAGANLAIGSVSVRSDAVEGVSNVGGIVGFLNAANVSNSFFDGAINSDNWGTGVSGSNIGGLIGSGQTTGCSISNSLAVGSMKYPAGDSTSTGAVLGINLGSCVTTSNFYSLNNPNAIGGSASPSSISSLNTKSTYTPFVFYKFIGVGDPTGQTLTPSPMSLDYFYDFKNNACYKMVSGSWTVQNTGCPAWFMPADTVAFPKLAFEYYYQDKVPFLKDECPDPSFYNTTPLTAADGGRIICKPSQIATVAAATQVADHLGKNLYLESPSQIPDGMYKIDGGGHNIYNWKSTSGHGLFGILQLGSVISNVNMIGAKVDNTTTTGLNLGIFADKNNGIINNVSVFNSDMAITKPSFANLNFRIGGLVGLNNGVIHGGEVNTNILVNGDQNAATVAVGGLAGESTGNISQVRVGGSIARDSFTLTTAGDVLGGLVGIANGMTMSEVEVETNMRANATSGSPSLSIAPVYADSVNTVGLTDFYVRSNLNYFNLTVTGNFNLHQGAGTQTHTRGFFEVNDTNLGTLMTDVPAPVANSSINVLYFTKSSTTNNNILYNIVNTVASGVLTTTGTSYNSGSALTVSGMSYGSGWTYTTSFADSLTSNATWRIDPSMGDGKMELSKVSGDFNQIGRGFLP